MQASYRWHICNRPPRHNVVPTSSSSSAHHTLLFEGDQTRELERINSLKNRKLDEGIYLHGLEYESDGSAPSGEQEEGNVTRTNECSDENTRR